MPYQQRPTVSGSPCAPWPCRWDIISPANSPSNCWEMVLSSKQHIECGDPLLLSYFEGGNDEFLLHYGFVPDSNPHDGVKLFGNISEALEHLWWQDQAQVSGHNLLVCVIFSNGCCMTKLLCCCQSSRLDHHGETKDCLW
eukprot:GHUV01038494.1.p1 GENE.GHUV01038494.1~~GHUV01038494.1.p1  ORF type:complete len:140 (-),score=24.57 GHUV01038494.1:428-847(-)